MLAAEIEKLKDELRNAVELQQNQDQSPGGTLSA